MSDTTHNKTGASPASQQFDRQAERYATSAPHRSGKSLKLLTSLAAEHHYRRALDIGTGPGFTAFAVAPYSDEVVATDIAAGMLQQVGRLSDERKIENVSAVFAAAEALPFKDASQDLVTCRTAAHHFGDLSNALDEIARVLKRDARFLLVDTVTSEDAAAAAWHNEMELRRDPSHIRCLAPSEWRERLRSAGFDIDAEAMTTVDMQLNDWTHRSGTPEDVTEQLRAEWAAAPQIAVEQFQLTELSGHDYAFSWPVLVVRAVKT